MKKYESGRQKLVLALNQQFKLSAVRRVISIPSFLLIEYNSGAGNIVQLTEYFPTIYKTLSSVSKTIYNLMWGMAHASNLSTQKVGAKRPEV